MKTVRVLLADDHELVRAGFRALMESIPNVSVVGEASNGREALKATESLRPDIVFLDISMPGLNGLDTVEQISQNYPGTRVVMLSMHANEEYVWRALRAGASGYLLKSSGRDELQMAIEAVAQGNVYLSPQVSKYVIADYIRRVGNEPRTETKLTTRQREVLQLIAEGYSTQEIAQILGVSTKTVETHRSQIMKQLGARNVANLVHIAIQMGLLLTQE
ncbi:MAG: DNA-binding response regulator [Anaerolineae bacterium]|nr:MAG: DNA-binding response regulator [Anaerolineae bacterium]